MSRNSSEKKENKSQYRVEVVSQHVTQYHRHKSGPCVCKLLSLLLLCGLLALMHSMAIQFRCCDVFHTLSGYVHVCILSLKWATQNSGSLCDVLQLYTTCCILHRIPIATCVLGTVWLHARLIEIAHSYLSLFLSLKQSHIHCLYWSRVCGLPESLGHSQLPHTPVQYMEVQYTRQSLTAHKLHAKYVTYSQNY